jgi:predicted phosphodiesterase
MQQTDGIYVMNPGSLESPRGKNPPTYGVIQLTDGNHIEMNIIAVED